jgi:hypothetical protein
VAFQSAHNTRVLLGDFSLSGKLVSASPKWMADMLDTTTILDAERNFIAGQESSSFSASGFYDEATHTDLTAWSSTNPLSFAPRGFAFGNEILFVNALRAQFTPGVQVAGVVSFDLEAQTDGPMDFGYSLHDLSAETGDSNSSTRDDSAATAGGAAGVLHVTAFSGFTSIDIDIRHSTDNFVGSNDSLIAFTQVTGVTSELKVATGTIRRYVRVVWTKSGTGSCTFACGFARR